jgi:hypothetical protein
VPLPVPGRLCHLSSFDAADGAVPANNGVGTGSKRKYLHQYIINSTVRFGIYIDLPEPRHVGPAAQGVAFSGGWRSRQAQQRQRVLQRRTLGRIDGNPVGHVVDVHDAHQAVLVDVLLAVLAHGQFLWVQRLEATGQSQEVLQVFLRLVGQFGNDYDGRNGGYLALRLGRLGAAGAGQPPGYSEPKIAFSFVFSLIPPQEPVFLSPLNPSPVYCETSRPFRGPKNRYAPWD